MNSLFRSLFSFSRTEISSAFDAVTAQRRFSGFMVLLAPASGATGKMLIITSRKVGKAHDRNLLRRRLKAIYYENRLFERPYTMIVIAQAKAVEYNPQKLLSCLNQALNSPLPASSKRQ